MRLHLVVCALSLCGLACESVVEPSLRDGEPTIGGPIVAVGVHTAIAPEHLTIHVKGSRKDECGIVFTVFPGTEIQRQHEDASLRTAGPEDLRTGVRVYVWTSVILSSCPGQAGAQAIEIVPG